MPCRAGDLGSGFPGKVGKSSCLKGFCRIVPPNRFTLSLWQVCGDCASWRALHGWLRRGGILYPLGSVKLTGFSAFLIALPRLKNPP
jgi:hypothetical protein